MKPKEEKNNNPETEQPVDTQAAAPQEDAPQGGEDPQKIESREKRNEAEGREEQ